MDQPEFNFGNDPFKKAKRRRDAGMASAAANSPKFSQLAFDAIERLARSQPQVHIDDGLALDLPKPRHPNAWGGVWARAIKAGFIQRSAMLRPCKLDVKKHAHSYPVYTSMVFVEGKP